jgi:hypothetical protein
MSGRLPPLASNSVAPATGDAASYQPSAAAKDPENPHEKASLPRAGSIRLTGDGCSKKRQVTYAIPVKELLTLAHQRGGKLGNRSYTLRFAELLSSPVWTAGF